LQIAKTKSKSRFKNKKIVAVFLLMSTFLLVVVRLSLTPGQENIVWFSNVSFSFLFFYGCAEWGYILAFTKVLTVYQICHTWIHPLYCSLSSSVPWFLEVWTGVIFAFTYMCMYYLHSILMKKNRTMFWVLLFLYESHSNPDFPLGSQNFPCTLS
jgi:hypothetical protein